MMNEDVANLLKKISDFRLGLNKQDWQDDKVYTNQNNPNQGYTYLSEKKLKDNIKAPLLEAGLEWRIVFDDVQVLEPVGSMRCHYSVRATMKLIDIDTGCSQDYVAYGEAADSGDKGLRKAETSALKAIMDNNFHISDGGFDCDREETRGFVTKAERGVIVESMQDNLVDPPKQEPPKQETKAESVPVQQTIVEDTPVRNISPLQEKAIARILENFEKAVDKGERTEDEYSICRFDANNVHTPAEASTFLKTWKV
jgi:hypothetical protein